MNGWVMAFSVLLSIIATVVFGLALETSAMNLTDTLKEGSRGSGRGGWFLRESMVVAGLRGRAEAGTGHRSRGCGELGSGLLNVAPAFTDTPPASDNAMDCIARALGNRHHFSKMHTITIC